MKTIMKKKQLGNGLYRITLSTDFKHISDLALRINDAMHASMPDVTNQEMFAAHAYWLGTTLGLAGAVMDFGTPEPGSLIAVMQLAYRDARQSREH